MVYLGEKNWNTAKTSCEANGAQLVKIESAEENDFINKQLLADGADYWIGLTDVETENHWKWTDGSNLSGYTNWFPKEPNNYNGQDCVAITKGNFDNKHYDGEWHDGECKKARGYICEN